MNILIAADSFKGSCSARQVTDTIERAAKNVIPDVIEAAKKELHKRNGGHYTCPLPDSVEPPLDTY